MTQPEREMTESEIKREIEKARQDAARPLILPNEINERNMNQLAFALALWGYRERKRKKLEGAKK